MEHLNASERGLDSLAKANDLNVGTLEGDAPLATTGSNGTTTRDRENICPDCSNKIQASGKCLLTLDGQQERLLEVTYRDEVGK